MTNEVRVKAGGIVFDSWKSVSVERNLNSLSGSFSLAVSDRWEETKQAWPLTPGVKVEIFIENDRVMIGYVDAVNPSVSGQNREMEITGRDTTADLVDCSVTQKFEFNNVSLDQLAQNFVKPFGIKVVVSANMGEKFTKWKVKQGETVFETLERAARLRAVLLITNGNGELVLTTPAGTRAGTDIVQGVNFYDGNATYDNKDRFSQITVKGNSSGTDEFYAEKVCRVKGQATDESVGRFRPFILVADSNVTSATAKKRAQWEITTRAAKSAQVNLSVLGWRKQNKKLWTTGEVTKVDAKFLGINQDMLIQSVNFVKGSSGSITNMGLVRPDAYTEFAEIKKKKDPSDNLGWSQKK